MSIQRRGLSVIEMSVSNMLMAILVLTTSSAVVHLGKPTLHHASQIDSQDSAWLVVDTIRRDLSGHLDRCQTGAKGHGMEVGRAVWNHSQLDICFDSASPDGSARWSRPDYVIRYYVDEGNLVRHDLEQKRYSVVARDVKDFWVSNSTDNKTTIVITIGEGIAEKRLELVSRVP